jgi:hypothetical protein
MPSRWLLAVYRLSDNCQFREATKQLAQGRAEWYKVIDDEDAKGVTSRGF